jgi:hypothetical protein
MKKMLITALALSGFLTACPAPVPVPVPVNDEQSMILLDRITSYSGGAGVVKVFSLGATNVVGTTVLATGTLDADGTFSVTFPNSASMNAQLRSFDSSTFCAGFSTCIANASEANPRVGNVVLAVYSPASASTPLGYLQQKTPVGASTSRTVWRWFATAPIQIQASKTSSGDFPVVDNWFLQFRRGWNTLIISTSTTSSQVNVDYTVGPTPIGVQWELSNTVNPAAALPKLGQ